MKKPYQYDSNLNNNLIEQDIRELFSLSFSLFNIAEGYKMIYKKDPNFTIPRKLIALYYEKINPNYNEMIYNFKRKYIANESLVEKNDTKEQRQGISLVYDYIQEYDINTTPFDIFVSTIVINNKLWQYRDQKFVTDQTEMKGRIEQLKKNAKENHSLEDYKKARELEKDLNAITDKSKIGGRFRSNDEEVRMNGLDIDVPSSIEATNFMNSFIKPENKKIFNDYFDNPDIFEYINYCIRITTSMIKNQPFVDGNKRTFRSLLNLMFKIRNIPPVYIKQSERNEYKEALYQAMKYEDYDKLYGFYYFKICDSIYELDVAPYLNKNVQKRKNTIYWCFFILMFYLVIILFLYRLNNLLLIPSSCLAFVSLESLFLCLYKPQI